MNEIFDVENRANMQAHFRTILVSYAVGLVNKDTDDRLVIRPGDFGVYEFQSVVDSSTRLDPINTLRKSTRPKEKVGANPPDDTAALRASREL